MIVDKDGKPLKHTDAGATDRDALDTFPLFAVPLTSNSLKNAKLIKNSRLETTVELHNDPISGSYQILPVDIAENFKGAEQDQELIVRLALLNSYDVFSLRGSIKKLGIGLTDQSILQLSDGMKNTLNTYSRQFTRPLLLNIFGSSNLPAGQGDDADLQQLLRDPDIARVRQNLALMTQKTHIPLADVPRFIEEYSDVYLSVAYYRHSFEEIGASIDRFLSWIDDLKHHRDVTATPQTLNSCKRTQETLGFLSTSIRERLNRLQYAFESFWKNINQASFIHLRQQVEESHSSMGAVLCGLMVKMRSWERAFPDNVMGGPVTRAKFVVTEMEPGLEHLKKMENEARLRLGLIPLKH